MKSKVTDVSDAVIPGVKATAINSDTNVRGTITPNNDGTIGEGH
ncbi:MAG: hypothetical protein ABI158_03270 [Edaphobacter sp.]